MEFSLTTAPDEADVSPWWIGGAFASVAIVVLLAVGGPVALFSSHLSYFGDMAGHDWWLNSYRTALLHGAPFGWTTDTNNGFLFGYFYFPLPPIIVTVLATVLSVAAASKCMVVLAVLSIPFGSWRLVKGLGYGRRVQVLTVLSGLAVLLSNHPITIGGTLYDTLLGEFSLALSIGLGLCALGAYAAWRRGAGPWWPIAVWGALSLLSHVQGALAAAIVLAVFVVLDLRSGTQWRQLALAGIAALGLSAWWWLPAYSVTTQSLGDVNPVNHSIAAFLFNRDAGTLVVVGVVGLVLAIWRRRAGALALLVASVVLSLLLLAPLQIADTGRLLPLVFVIAGIGLALALNELWQLVVAKRSLPFATPVTLVVAAILVVGLPMVNSFNPTVLRSFDSQTFKGMSPEPGYDGVRSLATALEKLPAGQVVVEMPTNYSAAYGTSTWPYLLPLWTKGHDASPLGLFVNATPSSIALEYAYENVTSVYSPVVSWQPRPAQPLPAAGINELRALGVNYLVVDSPALEGIVRQLTTVRLVATVTTPSLPTTSATDTAGTYWVYAINDSQRVVSNLSVVGMVPQGTRRYASTMATYLSQLTSRPHITTLVEGLSGRVSGAATAISDIRVTNSTIRFHVSAVGTPVLIRMTYSPEWHATGAGPVYRALPNEMVVIPTSTTVTLHFQNPATVPVAAAISALTILGLLGGLGWRRRRRRTL